MTGIFETVGVSIVAVCGIVLGWLFSRLRKPFWTLGYFLPFLLIAAQIAVTMFNSLAFNPPFCWVTAGRVRFVVLAFAITMGLTTPLSRLHSRVKKLIVCGAMLIAVVRLAILPFAVPAVIRGYLYSLETKFGTGGVCLQTTDYTCGPAAAVTALAKLGIRAQEGELAVLSHSAPVTGTLPHCLYQAIQRKYAAQGLECQWRYFESPNQLKAADAALVVVKDSFLSDHCVAVLDVTDAGLIIADPVLGTLYLSHPEFEKVWRFCGILLTRNSQQNI